MNHVGTEASRVLETVAVSFTVLFTVEWIMRMWCDGCSFFSLQNKNFGWNTLDTVVVTVALLDVLLTFIASSLLPSVFGLLRILRLARIARILRVLRFSIFASLRLMVHGIIASFAPLVWAIVLLALTTYAFAAVLLQLLGDELRQRGRGEGGDVASEDIASIWEYFPSMARTMWSLYMCVSGGISWHEVADPLIAIHPGLCFFFAVYIAFSGFVVLNIITAVFVQNAHSMTMKDGEQMILEELDSRRQWLEEVKGLFRSADEDQSGELTWEEFAMLFQDDHVLAHFRKLGIDIVHTNMKGLFNLLNSDGSGRVSIDELTSSMLMVHGAARSIDIVHLRHDMRLMRKQLLKFANSAGHASQTLPRKSVKL
mmetsp:Transcript_94459/g.266729  ORF Transcript_94459/g.266729 Transcript_94459/m.266729 type:complete len:370 (+) Transcript_94459:1-1110(+)